MYSYILSWSFSIPYLVIIKPYLVITKPYLQAEGYAVDWSPTAFGRYVFQEEWFHLCSLGAPRGCGRVLFVDKKLHWISFFLFDWEILGWNCKTGKTLTSNMTTLTRT